VYYEGEKEEWFVKRFLPEYSKTATGFIGEHEQSKLWVAATLHHPHVRIRYNRRFKHTRDREDDILDLRGFISVKGVKALGNKLSSLPVTEVSLEPPVEELEQSHERELQAARDADAERERQANLVENAADADADTDDGDAVADDAATDDPSLGEGDSSHADDDATDAAGAAEAATTPGGQGSLF
jgi:topoisomerase-4 subunit A